MRKKLADLLAFKANLFEVLIIAVLVALGVNVLSSGLMGYFNFTFFELIAIGFLLILTGALMLFRNASPMNNGKYKYKGIICIEENSGDLIDIIGYPFAEEVSRNIKALCAENKALHKIWHENPIGCIFDFDGNQSVKKKIKSNDLFIEAIEYYVIETLANHLSSHFNDDDSFSDEYLVKLDRKNIPNSLLGNRFIDTFSRPMEEREKFLGVESDPSEGKIVYAFGEDGAIFNHFEMVLPEKSSIVRESDSSISVITKRFKINFRPEFEGYNANFPSHFEKLYLGKDFLSVSNFAVGLIVTVDFSKRSLLSTKGWEYYWWLDSFLTKLEQSFSKDYFLSKISWHQNSAMILMAENRSKMERSNYSKSQKKCKSWV
ncbi:hypothetical protein GJV06_00765 [Enterobacteriaceae bacterium RIT691]|nr:hypothetical protein [Enterobacteriaceae bacterium RIT691]